MPRQILTLREEKKHSVLYDGVKGDPKNEVVSSIYVGKGVISKPYPSKLVLTLEPWEGGE